MNFYCSVIFSLRMKRHWCTKGGQIVTSEEERPQQRERDSKRPQYRMGNKDQESYYFNEIKYLKWFAGIFYHIYS